MSGREDSSTPVSALAAAPGAPGVPLADGPANPTALTVEQLAKMLGVPVERVRDHVAAGMPTAVDGTVNLIHYAAWLNRELASIDGDG